MRVAGRVVLFIAVVASCVRTSSTECDGKFCAAGTRCVIYTPTGGAFCAPGSDPDCVGRPDGTLCDSDKGTCYGGGCLPVGCGNGEIDDAAFARGEECDDGNRRSHDGCSSSCTNELATWTIEVPGPISNSSGLAMAYDSARDTIVAFGGVSRAERDATWLRVGARWQFVRPRGSQPTGRSDHALAYDAARHVTVMFGGVATDTGLRGDTWEWDGAQWRPRFPADAPPRRSNFAMAYDPLRHRVVIHGGSGDTGVLDDTWTWDGTDWAQVSTSGPPALKDHAMVFDPARGEILLVGEAEGTGVETWRFDGAAWSLAARGGRRGARSPLSPSIRRREWCSGSAIRVRPSSGGGTECSGRACRSRLVPPAAFRPRPSPTRRAHSSSTVTLTRWGRRQLVTTSTGPAGARSQRQRRSRREPTLQRP